MGRLAMIIFGPFLVLGLILSIGAVAAFFLLISRMGTPPQRKADGRKLSPRAANGSDAHLNEQYRPARTIGIVVLVTILVATMGFGIVSVPLAFVGAGLAAQVIHKVFLPLFIFVGVLYILGRAIYLRTGKAPSPKDQPRKRDQPLAAAMVAVLIATVLFSAKVVFDVGSYAPGSQMSFREALGKHFLGEGFVDPGVTKFGVRWVPRSVSFGNDNDTLLVDLCHVSGHDLCRIGWYSISKNEWRIVPYEENKSYSYPMLSPDGEWIVAGVIPCKDYYCGVSQGESQLCRMRTDGSDREILAVTRITRATFSPDGTRLLYSRSPDGKARLAYKEELHVLDWRNKSDQVVTTLEGFLGQIGGRPYLLAKNRKVIFGTADNAWTRDSKMPPPSPPFNKPGLFIGSMEDIPISPTNYQTLQRLDIHRVLDVDREGRILYVDELQKVQQAGSSVARAIRTPNSAYKWAERGPPSYIDPKTGEAFERVWDPQKDPHHYYEHYVAKLSDEEYRRGVALDRALQRAIQGTDYQLGKGYAIFLRKPLADAKDVEAVFDLSWGIEEAALSPDGEQIAFVHGSILGGGDVGIGILNKNDPMKKVKFIDWPKLTLRAAPIPKH
ncbi:MAG: hypothetical protein EG825_08310 [Rhodocyclaceae bacterium]|nr:hypothetical protein [Rhodocyclaceae bacterium]